MGYQILFTDFDGTLYAGDNIISELNTAAIKRATAVGKTVIINSGRSWKSLEQYEKMLGLDTPGCYGIVFNGGVVYAITENGREFLYRRTMETANALEIIRQLKLTDNIDKEIFVYAKDDDLYAEAHLKVIDKIGGGKRFKCEILFVEDFTELTDIIKIVVYGKNGDLKKLQEQMPFDSVFSADDLLEFLPQDVNKGLAMEFLAEKLNIPMDEVIAMGDAGNDAEMLKAAGLGIAVANSSEMAKEAADLVLAESCAEDAVAVVIDRYLLRE